MLIFDLDGTLLNTLTDLHNALNYALSNHGCKQKTLEETKMLLGNGIERLVQDSIENGKDNPEYSQIFKTFKMYYTAHINDNTAPYDGIIPLLKKLKANHIKTGIVSNKFDEGVKTLATHYFKDLIDAAQGTTEKIQKKPSPDAVFALIKRLNAENEKNIYIGDSEIDIMTAKNANLPCISVSWGFRTKEELMKSGAKIIIDSPQKLLNFLNN